MNFNIKYNCNPGLISSAQLISPGLKFTAVSLLALNKGEKKKSFWMFMEADSVFQHPAFCSHLQREDGHQEGGATENPVGRFLPQHESQEDHERSSGDTAGRFMWRKNRVCSQSFLG